MRERIFHLDFIRAIATVLIVLTHFNALYVYNIFPTRPEMAVITLDIANIYIGAFGVTLFLIISGASLMHVYGDREKFDLKSFYKKRFLSIYPMFWIAFLIFFLYTVFASRGINGSIPKYSIIYSIFGVDGLLLSNGVPNFYCVGEWFLGFIIIFYLVFPILLFLMKKHPIVLAVLTVGLYVLGLWFVGKDIPVIGSIFVGKSTSLFVRLPELVFGMFYIKYRKEVKWYAALLALAVLVLNTIIAPNIDQNIQTTYIGFAAFIFLVFISRFFNFGLIPKLSSTVCKYSYACFLVHHQIIYIFALKFNLAEISRTDSYLLFIFCSVIIAFASYFLYRLNDKTVKYVLKK